MKKISKIILLLALTWLVSTDTTAQTAIPVCAQMNTFTGMTRGYHFTAPTTFTICGVYVEDDASTAFQSVAIVRFTAGAPPAYAGTTNSFVTLFQDLNYVPNNMISVPNITINAGDIIGVYGSRTANSVNSYGSPNCGLMINGLPTTARRSGMQFDLAAGPGMHDIWSEVNYNIGRVTMYTNCCPTPPAITSIAGPITVCEGDVANYTCPAQTGAMTYTWAVPAGATINSGQGTNAINVTWNAATPPDSICVTWDDSCTTSPSFCVGITVNPLPIAPIASGITICLNSSALLTATSPGGTYEWYTDSIGGTLLSTGAAFNTPLLSVNTTYYVQTTVLGCTSQRAPVLVTIAGNSTTFTADTLSGCVDHTVNFTNTTDPNIVVSTFWDFGDGLTGTTDPIQHIYTVPGVYSVSLAVTDTGGCVGVNSKPNYINVFELPTADFSMDPGTASMFDPKINFFDHSFNNIVSWSWDFGGTGFSIDQNPVHLFPSDTGTYPISLTVTNALGCENTMIGLLSISGEFGVYLPNAFTPDGNGENDGFGPQGFGMSENEYVFRIFDRWGGLLFESHKLFQPWYGNFKGQPVPNGTYVWKLSFVDINGKDRDRVGSVNIIR